MDRSFTSLGALQGRKYAERFAAIGCGPEWFLDKTANPPFDCGANMDATAMVPDIIKTRLSRDE